MALSHNTNVAFWIPSEVPPLQGGSIVVIDKNTPWETQMQDVGGVAGPVNVATMRVQPLQPPASKAGDFWLDDSVAPPKLRVYDGNGLKYEDLNAVTISTGPTAPATAQPGDIWFDTSATPQTLKVYDGNRNAFFGVSGVGFQPPADLAAAPGGAFAPRLGDLIVHNGAAGVAIDAAYAGAAGQIVNPGDMVLFDGTQWNAIPALGTVLGNYLPFDGGNMTPGDATQVTFAPATKLGQTTVLNLGEGKVEDAWFDSGVY